MLDSPAGSSTPIKGAAESFSQRSNGGGNSARTKGAKPQNARFQRVKVEEVSYLHQDLVDNSFESRLKYGANVNDYGAKASRDLIVTRGKAFTKEKNKKKKGAYSGGVITMESHSIKFDD